MKASYVTQASKRNNIRFLRRQREITQDQLAHALGARVPYIYRWEHRDVFEMPLRQLRRIAYVLQVGVEDLYQPYGTLASHPVPALSDAERAAIDLDAVAPQS